MAALRDHSFIWVQGFTTSNLWLFYDALDALVVYN